MEDTAPEPKPSSASDQKTGVELLISILLLGQDCRQNPALQQSTKNRSMETNAAALRSPKPGAQIQKG